MAGETIKTQGVCLRITPWSRTSHIVAWLTPTGRVNTVVKGAVRPKSPFLGQYDLNYTCELVYYARGRGDLRTLKECAPLDLRCNLRQNLAALALADRFRRLCDQLAPNGPDAAEWYAALTRALDDLCGLEDNVRESDEKRIKPIAMMLEFELRVLRLMGQHPEIAADSGAFALHGERKMPISAAAARCLARPRTEKNPNVLFDAARVIGVYYAFHVENAVEGRRQILQMVSQPTQGYTKEGKDRKDG